MYKLQLISFEVFNFDDVGGSMIFMHFKSMNEVGYVHAWPQIYTGVLSCTNIPRLVNIIKSFFYKKLWEGRS